MLPRQWLAGGVDAAGTADMVVGATRLHLDLASGFEVQLYRLNERDEPLQQGHVRGVCRVGVAAALLVNFIMPA